MKSHVSQEKKKVVGEFVKLLKEYPIVGAVDMENLPARQLQNMRSQLRGVVVILMTKKRLLKVAIEQVKDEKPGIEQLIPHLKGMPALIFTKDNPFTLYKKLAKNKSNAPARGGQKEPKDIIVPAGPTSFAPGPVIGELGQLGIKAGIEGGKVAIKADATVAKEGQVISAKLAAILTRLGIEPMEIGLDLVAVYEKGTIYGKSILAVDEKAYLANITKSSQESFNLAVFIGYASKDTITLLLQKGFRDSKAVAKKSKFMADAVAGDLLAQAEREMLAVKSAANIMDAQQST